jgi:hypothetical protein
VQETERPTPEWKLDIPDEPVDGFKVEWFRVCADFGIKHMEAVYFVDEPYLDHRGEPGVNITDQWMIYEKGRPRGRTNEGWDQINFQPHDSRFSKRYKTYDEAVAAYLILLDNQEKAAWDRLKSLQQRRKNLPLKFDPDYSEHDLR